MEPARTSVVYESPAVQERVGLAGAFGTASAPSPVWRPSEAGYEPPAVQERVDLGVDLGSIP